MSGETSGKVHRKCHRKWHRKTGVTDIFLPARTTEVFQPEYSLGVYSFFTPERAGNSNGRHETSPFR